MAEQYDLPWKEALDRLLMPFLALFFPAVHEAVDWSEEPENLETELARFSQDSAVGNRRADKLFRVRLASGERRMLLLHIEVQTTFDSSLPERMVERRFREKIVELKENPKMRYVTSFERIVRQEGLEDGLRQGREQGRKGRPH